jgi:hypothetical protein
LFSCFLVFLFSCFLVFLFSCLVISKTTSKEYNSGLQMNFFRESGKLWTKSPLTLWKRWSETD